MSIVLFFMVAMQLLYWSLITINQHQTRRYKQFQYYYQHLNQMHIAEQSIYYAIEEELDQFHEYILDQMNQLLTQSFERYNIDWEFQDIHIGWGTREIGDKQQIVLYRIEVSIDDFLESYIHETNHYLHEYWIHRQIDARNNRYTVQYNDYISEDVQFLNESYAQIKEQLILQGYHLITVGKTREVRDDYSWQTLPLRMAFNLGYVSLNYQPFNHVVSYSLQSVLDDVSNSYIQPLDIFNPLYRLRLYYEIYE